MILVIGATGTVGREVTRQLVARGTRPRVLARSPEKLGALGDEVETVSGSLDDASAIARAVEGARQVFLLSAGLDGPRHEQAVVAAARNAQVEHVVKLSVMGAEHEGIDFARWHRASERAIEDSGLAWTFLRPGSFASNALAWVASGRRDGGIVLPVGDGSAALIDPADVGAVAVEALLSRRYDGQALTLSGPRP